MLIVFHGRNVPHLARKLSNSSSSCTVFMREDLENVRF